MSARAWLADPIAAALCAGLGLGAVEVIRLGALGRPALAVTALAVVAVTGALVGAAIALVTAARGRLARLGRAVVLVEAAPVIVLGAPLGSTLFQGAFAATLPGARHAPIAIPIALWLATAVAIVVGRAVARRGRWGVRAVVAALAGATLVLFAANAVLFRSGYPTVHAVLVVGALATAGLAVWLGLGRAPSPRRLRWALPVATVVVAVATARFGLASAGDRAVVATRGDQLRHLARVARAVVDLDGDGSSAILGGGDCDERDPARHVGASDRPGNGIDEDCDGVDASPPPVATIDRGREQSLEAWRATPEVAALSARARDANLLIISIDTLRADHLRADDPLTAHLRGFLASAAHFTTGLAPSAGTDVSMTTVATGRWNPFQPIAMTLGEALTASGRTTHAVLPREVLRYAGETLLTRGWATVDRVVTDGARRDVGDRVTAGEMTDRALAFLDRTGAGRFALWVHYFDVHEHAQIAVPAAMLAAVDPSVGPVARRYRAMIGAVDVEIGRLLDELARRGRADDTVVVLLSDHGESLGDDPRLPERHGLVVYHALTHVPVAVRVPGAAPRALAAPMSLVDVPATVAGLLALPGPTPVDGVDLSDDILGAPEALIARDRTLVMHEQDQWAVVAWPWKLLVRPADNLTELYDLSKDPGERDDRAAHEPARVTELRGRYGWFPPVSMDRTTAGRRWRERQAQRPPSPSTP